MLKRYKYPPNRQESAIKIVLRQAETMGEELTETT